MSKTIMLKPTVTYAILSSLGWILVIVLITGVWFYFRFDWIIFAAIPPVFIISFKLISWRQVRYEISPHQIKYSRGVLQRRVDFLEMYRIKDFDQRQSLVMRIFRIMHIRLMTSDISHPELELNGIPESNIPDILRQLVEQARKENRVYAID